MELIEYYRRDRYYCSAKLLPWRILSKNSGIAGAKAEELKSVEHKVGIRTE